MKKLIYILCLFITLNLFAQNETFNWYFGNKSAINFNTPDGEPKVVDNVNFYSFEGCASISDSNGNLLFYTNGSLIYNNKGNVINNNNKMLGDFHSTQSSLIIKLPNSDNIYYIFTTDAGLYADSINKGFNYTIVKSDINGTEIKELNKPLLKNSTEKLTACYHQNGKDVWIIAHEWSTNAFIANLLTEKGIEKQVKSNVGIIQQGDSNLVIGYMKSSPRGDKIALTCVTNSYAELFKFDNVNGIISNPITISLGNRVANYGLEFSPSGNYLYICDANEGLISQFNVKDFDKQKIENSEKIIAKEKNDLGALQLAPNGKIYIANLNTQHLSEIQYPEKEGDNCNYVSNSIILSNIPDRYCSYGMPNFNAGLFDFNLKIEPNEFCEGDLVFLNLYKLPKFKNTKYSWTGPNGFKTSIRELRINTANKTDEGWYYLKADYFNFTIADSIYLKIIEVPKAKIIAVGDFSNDGYLTLKSELSNNEYLYVWSTGDTATEIRVTSAGKYYLNVYNKLGCYTRDSIEISSIKDAIKFLNPDTTRFDEICIGGSDIKDIKIVNTGTQNILINDITFENSNSEFQIMNKNQIIGSINAGSQKLIRVRFYTGTPGNYTQNLIISTSYGNDNQTFQTDIKGDAKADLMIWIPELKQDAGKKLSIPIYAKLQCYEGIPLITDLNFKLIFHKDFFYPESLSIGNFIKSFENDSFKLDITLNNVKLNDKEIIIANLDGVVLPGNFSPDSININSIELNHNNVNIISQNGSLEVTGCASQIRPVQKNENTTMKITPNYFKETADISIYSKENGTYIIDIYSLEGQKVESITFTYYLKEYSEFIKIIDLANYNKGVYFVVLRTHSTIIRKKLMVNY